MKIKSFLPLFAVLTLISGTPAVADASIMSAGDIAFTGFNADGEDALQFVALADIDADTTIFFTDRNWDGAAFFSLSEGILEWNSGAALIAAGTVIEFNSLQNASTTVTAGSILGKSGSFNLSGTTGDQVFAFLDASADLTPDTFLASITNVGYPGGANSTLAGTGLASGTTAVSFTGAPDVMEYTGLRTGENAFSDYLPLIGDTGNWLTNDGSGDQSLDGSEPDVPFNSTSFSVVPEPSSLLAWSILGACGLMRRRRSYSFRAKHEGR